MQATGTATGRARRTPPRWATILACAGVVGTLGVVDHINGYLLGFFVFYFIPVCLAAWLAGRSAGMLLAVLSAVVWLMVDRMTGSPFSTGPIGFWNAGIRLVSFAAMAYATARIRSLIDEERKLARQLRQSLADVRTLSGLLPICARCKKIRDDKGYWQRIEDYLSRHTDATFTHGLCRHCADDMLKDAGLPPLTGSTGLESTDDPVPPATDGRA